MDTSKLILYLLIFILVVLIIVMIGVIVMCYRENAVPIHPKEYSSRNLEIDTNNAKDNILNEKIVTDLSNNTTSNSSILEPVCSRILEIRPPTPPYSPRKRNGRLK